MQQERRRELNTRVGSLSDQLFDWRLPDEFTRIVDELGGLVDLLPSTKIASHRQRTFKIWRESWVLKSVLQALAADRVRLRLPAGDDNYDAEITRGDLRVPIEITEAIEADRFPTKPDLVQLSHDGDVETWRETVATIPRLLEDAAGRKVSKSYARRVSLVVYLNSRGTYGIAQPEIRQMLKAFVDSQIEHLHEIHVLWGAEVVGRAASLRSVD